MLLPNWKIKSSGRQLRFAWSSISFAVPNLPNWEIAIDNETAADSFYVNKWHCYCFSIYWAGGGCKQGPVSDPIRSEEHIFVHLHKRIEICVRFALLFIRSLFIGFKEPKLIAAGRAENSASPGNSARKFWLSLRRKSPPTISRLYGFYQFWIEFIWLPKGNTYHNAKLIWEKHFSK